MITQPFQMSLLLNQVYEIALVQEISMQCYVCVCLCIHPMAVALVMKHVVSYCRRRARPFILHLSKLNHCNPHIVKISKFTDVMSIGKYE